MPLPRIPKKAWGRLAYLLAGAKSLGEIKPIHARVYADGVEDEDDFLFGMMCSTKSVGGFRSPNIKNLRISLNDGLSEVIFVRNIRNLLELNEAAGQILKLDFSDKKRFLSFQTRRMRVEFDAEVSWTVDGEAAAPVERRCWKIIRERSGSSSRRPRKRNLKSGKNPGAAV